MTMTDTVLLPPLLHENFAAAWHDCTARDPDHRGAAEVDNAFWLAHARGYDLDANQPHKYQQTLAFVESLISTNDFVLDVGAGTGRFAIPLARKARHVTALDHATPMLKVLRENLTHTGISNVRPMQAAWEDVTISPHDVVLAAWSLYRLPNILTGIQKLIAATKRTLIIVASPGSSIAHDPLLAPIWGHLDEVNTPLYLYFYGVLWQAGALADSHIITEHQPYYGDSAHAIATQLAPQGATAAEIIRLTTALTPHLTATAQGYCYQRPQTVGVLVWHRP